MMICLSQNYNMPCSLRRNRQVTCQSYHLPLFYCKSTVLSFAGYYSNNVRSHVRLMSTGIQAGYTGANTLIRCIINVLRSGLLVRCKPLIYQINLHISSIYYIIIILCFPNLPTYRTQQDVQPDCPHASSGSSSVRGSQVQSPIPNTWPPHRSCTSLQVSFDPLQPQQKTGRGWV